MEVRHSHDRCIRATLPCYLEPAKPPTMEVPGCFSGGQAKWFGHKKLGGEPVVVTSTDAKYGKWYHSRSLKRLIYLTQILGYRAILLGLAQSRRLIWLVCECDKHKNLGCMVVPTGTTHIHDDYCYFFFFFFINPMVPALFFFNASPWLNHHVVSSNTRCCFQNLEIRCWDAQSLIQITPNRLASMAPGCFLRTASF